MKENKSLFKLNRDKGRKLNEGKESTTLLYYYVLPFFFVPI